MKRLSIVGSMLLVLLLSMTSCEQPTESLLGPYSNSVILIKLAQPEYKNYVLACSDSEYAYNLYGRCNVLGDGALPYWELADGYLLIDWRWYLFPSYDDDYPAVCLLSEPWTPENSYAYSDDDIAWLLDTCQYVTNPIVERICVDMAKVNKYLGAEELYRYEYQDSHTEHGEGTQNLEDYRAITTHMDSVWTYTQQQLNAVIKDKKINKMIRSEEIRW